jgi:hypothetical protein
VFVLKKRYILIIGIIIALLAGGYLAYTQLTGGGETAEEKRIYETFGYKLVERPTSFQKEMYDELLEVLNSENLDKKVYSEVVLKNFVADFFTWVNKRGSYDVGGLSYIVLGHANSFMMNARSSFYIDVTDLMNEYGKENLLMVDSITVVESYPEQFSDLAGNIIYDEGYYVVLEWTYASNELFDSSGYQNRIYANIVFEEGVARIAQLQY